MSTQQTLPTTADIVDTLALFECWEDRYRYIIELGQQLPALAAELKTDDHLIRGCQSRVWLHGQWQQQRLQLQVDSDAHIVKGLLVLVLAAYHNRTADQILAFDIEHYFNQTHLLRHLSPTRGNGLRAMVQAITAQAKAYRP